MKDRISPMSKPVCDFCERRGPNARRGNKHWCASHRRSYIDAMRMWNGKMALRHKARRLHVSGEIVVKHTHHFDHLRRGAFQCRCGKRMDAIVTVKVAGMVYEQYAP